MEHQRVGVEGADEPLGGGADRRHDLRAVLLDRSQVVAGAEGEAVVDVPRRAEGGEASVQVHAVHVVDRVRVVDLGEHRPRGEVDPVRVGRSVQPHDAVAGAADPGFHDDGPAVLLGEGADLVGAVDRHQLGHREAAGGEDFGHHELVEEP
ncbi:hypothetical protein [Kitasatospora paranensis]|uniref:hypothetical protein n=1 Tax=Kitasatospora paranensis TaxID=258053 RepID=UPI0031E6FE76